MTLAKGNKATVHHQLTTDPYNKRGQTGTIAKIEDDIITLLFQDGSTGRYMIDTLIPENHIEVIIKTACPRTNTKTFRFKSMEAARSFIAEWKMEDKVIDII